jgi:hypothetical protein
MSALFVENTSFDRPYRIGDLARLWEFRQGDSARALQRRSRRHQAQLLLAPPTVEDESRFGWAEKRHTLLKASPNRRAPDTHTLAQRHSSAPARIATSFGFDLSANTSVITCPQFLPCGEIAI